MTQPEQPGHQPSGRPANQQGESNPPTQPMPAAQGAPGPTSPVAPKRNLWQQATSTRRRRVGLAAGAFALAALLLLGFAVAGIAALRLHDRVNLVGDRGDRRDGFSRGRDDPGEGRGPGADERNDRRNLPGQPRLPGGRDDGLGGLGGLLNGAVLHGQVTASVNGSVQALLFQLGEVTAASATSITLKSSDGFTGTYGLTSTTTSRRGDAVKGRQAFVLARAGDKVAIRVTAGKTLLR